MGMDRGKMYTESTTQRRLCRDQFDCMVRLDELVEHDQVTVTTRVPVVCAAMSYHVSISNDCDLRLGGHAGFPCPIR